MGVVYTGRTVEQGIVEGVHERDAGATCTIGYYRYRLAHFLSGATAPPASRDDDKNAVVSGENCLPLLPATTHPRTGFLSQPFGALSMLRRTRCRRRLCRERIKGLQTAHRELCRSGNDGHEARAPQKGS